VQSWGLVHAGPLNESTTAMHLNLLCEPWLHRGLSSKDKSLYCAPIIPYTREQVDDCCLSLAQVLGVPWECTAPNHRKQIKPK